MFASWEDADCFGVGIFMKVLSAIDIVVKCVVILKGKDICKGVG